MEEVTIKISDKVQDKAKDACWGLYPVVMIPDTVDPNLMVPKYTKKQWLKQCMIANLKRDIEHYLYMQGVAAAQAAQEKITDEDIT